MRVRAALSLVSAVLLLAACKPAAPVQFPADASAPPDAPAPPATAAAAPAPSPAHPPAIFAPFPYTAEQIRDASPSGRVCRFRVVDPNGETLTRMSFSEADEAGVIVQSSVTTPDGESVGDSQARSSWEELVLHAGYPAGFTTITPVEVTVAAGTFQAQLYEVADGGGGIDMRVWFADEMAGPPVKLEDLQAGEIMVSMELIESSVPDAS